MDSTELLEQFRLDVSDLEAPYLWSDAEVFRYMDDAQKMFCRLTGGIGDATSAVTVYPYTTATDWINLSPLILYIHEAYIDRPGRSDRIDVGNVENFRHLNFDGLSGNVRALITGIEPNRARMHRYPHEDGTIRLRVSRLPLRPITDDGDQRFEIDEQHHQHLALWMMHRAYSKQDAETFDKTKAAAFRAAFEQYCFDAKGERERAMGKIRTVAYGGI